MIEPEFEAFADCWNSGRFFEAHEVLEGLWMRTRDPGQQGLIQLAAALYHVERGNLRGARTMLDRALRRLRAPSAQPAPFPVQPMIEFAYRAREELDETNGTAVVGARPRVRLEDGAV